jgi:hypothetical protein
MLVLAWKQTDNQLREGEDMKNARQILEEFTASSFRAPKKAAEMFAEDGAFEMPYLDSLGFPWRYEGREGRRILQVRSAISIRTWIFTM